MKKSIIKFLMIAGLFLLVGFLNTNYAKAFAGGDGTLGDPFQIANCTELQDVGSNTDDNFILNNDINCTGWNGGSSFMPIGTSGLPFTGSFNGNNHTITGLYVNVDFANGGLFGYTSSAVIKNLGVVGANITSANSAGAVAGTINNGTVISDSYSSGNVMLRATEPTTFHIKKLNSGTFEDVYKKGFPVKYATQNFSFNNLKDSLTLEINQYGNRPFAGVEAAVLNACGGELIPSSAFYSDSNESVLEDVLSIDNNVSVIHEKPIQVSWNLPKGCTEATLALTANEYDKGSPLKYPRTGLMNYKIGSNDGSLFVDGKINEIDGANPLYTIHWAPDTGHPEGDVYLYAKDDKNYLYFATDVTIDNTNDNGQDWIAVTIDGKRFLVDDNDSTYGKCAFGLTSKVAYKHQTCELKIPKNLINNKDNSSFVLEYYGTAAAYDIGAGGLVGVALNGSVVEKSYSSANVNGYGYTGALPFGYGPMDNIGGLIGGAGDTSIANSYATGNVGEIGARNFVGGFIGNSFSSSVLNSYSIGQAHASSSNLGGFIGTLVGGTVTNSYWDTESSGNGTSFGGTGQTTSEMKDSVNFSSWDFTDVWDIDGTGFINNGYPYLDPTFYSLTYTALDNGALTGLTSQTIYHGSDGFPVTAVPDSGYYFANWSDDTNDNPRTDEDITQNISVQASFINNSVIYVNRNYQFGDCNPHTCDVDAFDTIQEGVDAVATDGTVYVAAEEYASDAVVTINKKINLVGPGIAGISSGDQATVVSLDCGINVLSLEASGIHVTGFNVRSGGEGYCHDRPAIRIINEAVDVLIDDNNIAGGNYGIAIQYDTASTTISNNIIHDSGGNGGRGISLASSLNNQIFNNEIYGYDDGVYMFYGDSGNGQFGGTRIYNNSIHDNIDTGIYFGTENQLSTVTIGPDNDITANSNGVYVEGDAYNLHANGNKIHDNAYGEGASGLTVVDASTGLDITGNWWGLSDGPWNFTYNPTEENGTNNVLVISNSDFVYFRPFCIDENCEELSTVTIAPENVATLFDNGGTIVPVLDEGAEQSPEVISVTSLNVNENVIIEVPTGAGTTTITIQKDTVITKTGGGTFDATEITAVDVVLSALSGFDLGEELLGAMQWGIPSLGLTFSEPITIEMYVGESLNGRTLTVKRSLSESSGWTTDGIISPGTCVVSNGACEFQTTKASYFASTQTTQTLDTSPALSSGSGIAFMTPAPFYNSYAVATGSGSTTPAAITVASTTKFIFTKNLKLGMTSSDVKELQKFLNFNGFTVSKTGAGSQGKETTKFGPATKSALIKFQKAQKINPSAGYFGPLTRKVVNGM